MNKNQRKRPIGGKTVLLVAFLAVAAVLGTLMLQKYEARHRKVLPPAQPVTRGTVQVSLFFCSDDSSGLVRETREIETCGNDTPACILSVLEELASGPLGNLAPTIPEKSTFRSIQIRGDTATVDMGKEIVEGLPKGSSSEMMAIFSIVNTISFNFPTIKKIEFLVEGKAIGTLGGHLDLRKPVEPDFNLEKKQG